MRASVRHTRTATVRSSADPYIAAADRVIAAGITEPGRDPTPHERTFACNAYSYEVNSVPIEIPSAEAAARIIDHVCHRHAALAVDILSWSDDGPTAMMDLERQPVQSVRNRWSNPIATHPSDRLSAQVFPLVARMRLKACTVALATAIIQKPAPPSTSVLAGLVASSMPGHGCAAWAMATCRVPDRHMPQAMRTVTAMHDAIQCERLQPKINWNDGPESHAAFYVAGLVRRLQQDKQVGDAQHGWKRMPSSAQRLVRSWALERSMTASAMTPVVHAILAVASQRMR